MAFQRDPDAGRHATAWLAVAFTLTTGAGVCAFIILAFSDSPRQAFLVLGAMLTGIFLLLWGMSHSRDRQDRRDLLAFFRKSQPSTDPADLYRPRKRKRKGTPLGSNEPPTLESVRKIAETNARWVPHGSTPRRDRPDR